MFSYLFKYKERFPFFLLFPLWLLICHVNLIFIGSESGLYGASFFALFGQLRFLFELPFFSVALFASILLFQAWLINYIFQENQITPKQSYLASAFYVLLVGLLNNSWMLSPAFIATTFVILCLHNYFQSYNNRSFSPLFNSGFYIGIASIIFPPSALLLLAVFVANFFVRLFSIKEWVASFIGFVIPIYLFGVVLYVSDSLNLWLEQMQISSYFTFKLPSLSSSTELITILFIAISLIFSIYKFQYLYLRSSIEERNKISICLYFLTVSLEIAFLFGAIWSQTLLLSLPTISILMAYGVYHTENLLFAEWLPLSLLAVVLFLHHLSEYFSFLEFFNF